MTTAVAPTTPPVQLTANDRCDRCGAQAYVRGHFLAGELLFCAHHAEKYGDKLKSQAVSLDDFTYKLAPGNRAQGTSH